MSCAAWSRALHSILKPARELAASQDLAHDERDNHSATTWTAFWELAGRARELQGHGVVVFACERAGLYEEIVLPRRGA